MDLDEILGALAQLGDALAEENDAKKFAIAKAYHENKWFTEHEVRRMINAIRANYLDYELLRSFVDQYHLPQENINSKTIGLIPAGNIPMVGFHDILCILISGHHAAVKLSERDRVLIPWVMSVLEAINLELARRVMFVSKLTNFDAVIATGSNNSAATFQRYFGQYKHIIRNNKTAIAILNGEETEDELTELTDDIFSYYGLGCRNISKIYVPKGYDFNNLGKVLNQKKELRKHSKYKNNFDYNLAVSLLNKDKIIDVESLLLVEKESIHSRIASLHYEYYSNLNDLKEQLINKKEELQVVTSNQPIDPIETKPLGTAQKPTLSDYADGIDTMKFLLDL